MVLDRVGSCQELTYKDQRACLDMCEVPWRSTRSSLALATYSIV